MNNTIKIFCLAVLLNACSSQEAAIKKEAENKVAAIERLQAAKPTKKFADIQFASRKDTTCGMPVSAGIEDTVVLKGKVYGFCSAECKAEFVTVLKAQHKR